MEAELRDSGSRQRSSHQSLLGEDSSTAFESKVLELQGKNEMLGNDMIKAGSDAVAQTVFPHQALHKQKIWMRRHSRKPPNWSFGKTSLAVTKINNCIPLFPSATENDKFSDTELIEILEYSVPETWRKEFDKKGYVPTEHD